MKQAIANWRTCYAAAWALYNLDRKIDASGEGSTLAHVHNYTCTSTHVHTYELTNMKTHTHIHAHAHTRTHIHAHAHTKNSRATD